MYRKTTFLCNYKHNRYMKFHILQRIVYHGSRITNTAIFFFSFLPFRFLFVLSLAIYFFCFFVCVFSFPFFIPMYSFHLYVNNLMGFVIYRIGEWRFIHIDIGFVFRNVHGELLNIRAQLAVTPTAKLRAAQAVLFATATLHFTSCLAFATYFADNVFRHYGVFRMYWLKALGGHLPNPNVHIFWPFRSIAVSASTHATNAAYQHPR